MKPIDQAGLGPRRECLHRGDHWLVRVTPPAWVGGPTVEIRLSELQYEGYVAWVQGRLIQDAMPFLTPDQREMLMTGLTGV